MPQKKNQSPQILQLFEGAEAAIAEIERNLGGSSEDLKKRLSEFSWRVRDKKEALLEGLLKVAENLNIAGPWKLPGRGFGWIRLDTAMGVSSSSWVQYSHGSGPFGSYHSMSVFNILTDSEYSRLYTPLCEVLIEQIKKAMTDLAPTTRRFKQMVRQLQKAAEVAKKPKSKGRRSE